MDTGGSDGTTRIRVSSHKANGAKTNGAEKSVPVRYTIRNSWVNQKNAAKLVPVMAALTTSGKSGNAAALLAAAKKDRNARTCFEWDDTVAGNAYRLWQARNYWGAIRITIESNGKEIRAPAFIPIRIKTADGENVQAYQDVRDVVRNHEWLQQSIAQAKRELLSFKKRYDSLRSLDEFGALFGALDSIELD